MKGSTIRFLEKALGTTLDMEYQSNLITLLKGMKENAFSKLIQESASTYAQEERNITIGELRVLQKLLEVLEPKMEVI